MAIYERIVTTPIGVLRLQSTEFGILSLFFNATNSTSRKAPSNSIQRSNLKQAEKEINEYFSGKRKKFDVSLDVKGTEFQKKVWKEMLNIPYGKTISYAQLGENLSLQSKSGDQWHVSRAIGGAASKNPLPILIPCHRVIGANGSIKGYIGGVVAKKTLISLEQKFVGSLSSSSSPPSSPSPPNTPPKSSETQKPPCKYGDKCFRKNKEHFKEFSHSSSHPMNTPKRKRSLGTKKSKSDSDSDSEQTDQDDGPTIIPGEMLSNNKNQKKEEEKKVCKFGADCFRKNKEHLEKYIHPQTPKKSSLDEQRTSDIEDQRPSKKRSICSSSDSDSDTNFERRLVNNNSGSDTEEEKLPYDKIEPKMKLLRNETLPLKK